MGQPAVIDLDVQRAARKAAGVEERRMTPTDLRDYNNAAFAAVARPLIRAMRKKKSLARKRETDAAFALIVARLFEQWLAGDSLEPVPIESGCSAIFDLLAERYLSVVPITGPPRTVAA